MKTEHRARQVMSLCPARCLGCHRLTGLSLSYFLPDFVIVR